MTLEERIEALVKLGDTIKLDQENWQGLMTVAELHNPWFTKENVQQMLEGIKSQFLNKASLEHFCSAYDINDQGKKIGLILAGNIPAVGFHDLLCCFLSGNRSIYKLSDKDSDIIPYLLKGLCDIAPGAEAFFTSVEKLSDFDAAIATGSNNSARYFEYYFSKVPHVIRKNRSTVAVLTGDETSDDFEGLADDINAYFGLGCRSVSKLCVLGKFDKHAFFEGQKKYLSNIHHSKYKNNYEYNYAIFLMNKMEFFTNDVLIAKPSDQLQSRIASIHYQEFEHMEDIKAYLQSQEDQLQVVVSKKQIFDRVCDFGMSQKPAINDFADGVDTMTFLTNL